MNQYLWQLTAMGLFFLLSVFTVLACIKNRMEKKRNIINLEKAYKNAAVLNHTLALIAKSSALYSGDLKKFADFIAEKGCSVLKTSRFEIWIKIKDKGSMKNISTYEALTGSYTENRPDFDMPNFEEYEMMLKTERLFTTNDAKMYEIFLNTRDSLSSKSIASIEAPIWIDSELAGVICIEQESCDAYPKRRNWSMEEHSFTTSLADLMTIVIINSERRRLENMEMEIRAEKERIGAELNVARQIQANMLPGVFPAFPGRGEFDIFAMMQPAREVGGDFYDFFLVDENTLALVIADVSGKGVPAALFMVIAKTLIKNTALSGREPGVVFDIVNRMLCENNETGMFVTAFFGYLDIRSGKFTFVNAGHNPPLLLSSGEFSWLKVKPCFILAGMEDTVYGQHEISLKSGDKLFLYTDGVTEAINNDEKLFGEQLLMKTASNNNDPGIKDFILSIKHEIDNFSQGAEQADDITMLMLEYKGRPMHELIIEAKLENTDTVIDFINEYLENCPSKIKNHLGIAVDEVFSNIARYAYEPENGDVSIRIGIDDYVSIEFEDSGRIYDPLSMEEPDLSLPLEDREIGGLGIFMVKSLMDSVEYERRDNHNILTIKKKL